MKNQIKFTLWQDDKIYYVGYFKTLQSAKNWLSRSVGKDVERVSIGCELNGKYKLLASRYLNDKAWLSYESYRGEFKNLGIK